MAIFRGVGGAGNATTDSEIALLTQLEQSAVAAAASADASKTNAALSATNAATSATNAATSATNAANSATASATSATNSANSATSAATSATNAAADANLAKDWATKLVTTVDGVEFSSKYYAQQSGSSATAAADSATAASDSASAASTSATDAATSETNAANSASAASTSATNAANSATSASNSASAASTSATNAANSASSAATSATNAANSASDAADSAAAAATFDPALYLTKADNLSGLANTTTARTNLGVTIGTDVQAHSPVTTSYAANGIGFRNRIINGDMRIDQRNAGASVTSNGAFPVDRFIVSNSTDGAFSAQQDSSAPDGFVNSLKYTVTPTADTSLGGTQWTAIRQKIEGTNISDLAWGSASAKTVTLSFWVRSSLTGTFGGAVANSDNSRSYPFTYAISVANTWEYKTVTVAGDTSGTWLTTNGAGIQLFWGLGVGATYSGTAGSWSGSLFLSATGAVSVIGTLNATFYITGVQLEAGSVATPFERRPFGTELALCQRYAILYTNCQFPTNTVSTPMFYVSCLGMRATPTVTHNIADANYANNPSANQWGYVDGGSAYSTKSGTLSAVSVWSSQATVGLRPLGATFSPTPNLAILNSNVFVLLASEL